MMILSHQKRRECAAILLGVLAAVGLGHKAGVSIPLVSRVVVATIQATLLLISKWITTRTVFVIYIKAFQSHIVWCVSSAWLGIAGWLWGSRDHSEEGFWEIVFYYYFFMTALVSSSAFAISYNLDPFFNIRFYSSSFALSLALSFVAGKSWSLVQELSRKNR